MMYLCRQNVQHAVGVHGVRDQRGGGRGFQFKQRCTCEKT